jgi:hypothetical protein
VSLARVPRLLRPLVAQVNIAQAGAQQLNVATGPMALAGQARVDALPVQDGETG